ncbi:uncharacterized protein LOC123551679 [Mercenaria mercenaria]|uniref:uncharacterized protein LOC123551679 n=1 Tax=Mercenaria mercenaria TaxID=6596 RepID=UPI00234E3FB0|nr:uncharacterized protein LOC123551679 [Mercenaria mercenaria]
MGNIESVDELEYTDWKFVGRRADLENFKKTLSKSRSVLVYGMKKIGKSRFMKEACRQPLDIRNTTYLWKDFELDDIESGYSQYDWFLEFLDSVGANQESFKRKFPLQKIACDSCELCLKPGSNRCVKQNDLIKSAVDIVIIQLKKCKHKILLFIDHIDKLMVSNFKDAFLYFHDKSLNCFKLKTILSSSNKPKNLKKGFNSFELRPLDLTAIIELLFDTTENRIVSDNQSNCNKAVKYSQKQKVFKPENKPYIDAIGNLCEGLPLAAVMSGLRLTEDYCFFKPADLVEILICMRLTSLSPDNCPPDDRLEIYKEPLDDVKDISSFFHCLNQQLTGTRFSIEQALAAAEASGDTSSTEARVKDIRIKKALDRCILSVQSLQEEEMFKWHGIFRECQASLQTLDELPAGHETAKNMVMKFMKENVMKAELDFDEEILRDPKSLEFAIRSLSCKEKTSTPVQAENDEKYKIMSSYEQHHQASKKVEATLYDTEHSAVMEVHKEVEIHKDVENSPSTDTGKPNKTAIRYSVSESSDSSDSDSMGLQFIVKDDNGTLQTKSEQITNGLHSVSPPPYTSRQGCSEEPELYHIQNSGERNVFRPINRQSTSNSAGEPPPYTSTDPIHHLSNNVIEPNRQYINNTSPHHISDSTAMNNVRPRSLPSDNSLLYNSQTLQESTSVDSRQRNYGDQSLRRARSDPTCNHFENISSRQIVKDQPRREIDTSIGYDSLTGPPAMRYIPPVLESFTHGSHEHPNTDTKMKNSVLRIDELKEPFSHTSVGSAFDRSGVSSQGPEDISYKKSLENVLHVDQEYFNQISHISSVQSNGQFYQIIQNRDTPPFQGQSYGRMLLVNQSKHEANAKERSRTAVVSPMQQRRSPPVAHKQLQNEQSFTKARPYE